jgi:hypothetical protein
VGIGKHEVRERGGLHRLHAQAVVAWSTGIISTLKNAVRDRGVWKFLGLGNAFQLPQSWRCCRKRNGRNNRSSASTSRNNELPYPVLGANGAERLARWTRALEGHKLHKQAGITAGFRVRRLSPDLQQSRRYQRKTG